MNEIVFLLFFMPCSELTEIEAKLPEEENPFAISVAYFEGRSADMAIFGNKDSMDEFVGLNVIPESCLLSSGEGGAFRMEEIQTIYPVRIKDYEPAD